MRYKIPTGVLSSSEPNIQTIDRECNIMYNGVKELQFIYKEAFMDKEKEPKLGDYEVFGNQYRVYTMRGWVICDEWCEVEEEIAQLSGLEESA